MNSKKLTTFLMVVGGAAGGYVPALWGASGFSITSLLFSSLGAILGIWIAFRLTR